MAKEKLRLAIREMLARLNTNEFGKAGQNVATHLRDWLQGNKNLLEKKRIVLFKSLNDEIAIGPISETLRDLGFDLYFMPLKRGPKEAFDLLINEWSIPDLMFVPGRAFDLAGNRLGRGVGFYDRFFALLKERGYAMPLLMGLALDDQILEYIPSEKHDVAMHYICTPALGVRETIGE